MKNDLFIRALDGKPVNRPPVWMMRQAGRYLPEYRELQDKYDFFTRCQTPELASEITVQPIRRFGFDAAILFSDILVVPQAMNIPVEMKPGVGPWLPEPVRTRKDMDKVVIPDITEALGYVLEAVQMTKEKLEDKVPLIGFAGSPWTVFCYCVEGQGSKDFSKAKAFWFQQPKLAHELLQKLTDTTILYLKEKVQAGCDVVQIFDSWGGMLSPEDYRQISWKYIRQIVDALAPMTKVIVFAKGCWFALEEMAQSPVSALGVDWSCPPELARKWAGGQVTLQGNLDPARLFSPPEAISKMIGEMMERFGTQRYIVNLGHGILPGTPLESVRAFVDTVKAYR